MNQELELIYRKIKNMLPSSAWVDFDTLYDAATNTPHPQQDVQGLVDLLEALHSDQRLVHGKYDYQCGFLDALKSVKQALKSYQEGRG